MDEDEEETLRESEPSSSVTSWRAAWARVPVAVRKPVVLMLGCTLIVTGLLLVVLPGPFTLPLVIAGVAVLSSEFLWAASLLTLGRRHGQRALGRLRDRRVLAAAVVVLIVGVALSIGVLLPRLRGMGA